MLRTSIVWTAHGRYATHRQICRGVFGLPRTSRAAPQSKAQPCPTGLKPPAARARQRQCQAAAFVRGRGRSHSPPDMRVRGGIRLGAWRTTLDTSQDGWGRTRQVHYGGSGKIGECKEPQRPDHDHDKRPRSVSVERQRATRTSRLSHHIFCLFSCMFSPAPIRGHRDTRKARQSMCKTVARRQSPLPNSPLSHPNAFGLLSPIQNLKAAKVGSSAAERGPPAQTKGTPSSNKWKTTGRQTGPVR